PSSLALEGNDEDSFFGPGSSCAPSRHESCTAKLSGQDGARRSILGLLLSQARPALRWQRREAKPSFQGSSVEGSTHGSGNVRKGRTAGDDVGAGRALRPVGGAGGH